MGIEDTKISDRMSVRTEDLGCLQLQLSLSCQEDKPKAKTGMEPAYKSFNQSEIKQYKRAKVFQSDT